MTINQLIKRLTDLEQVVGKRASVCIEWETFQHPEITHNDIAAVEVELIGVDDGDGYLEMTSKGVPKERRVITIRGHWPADKPLPTPDEVPK